MCWWWQFRWNFDGVCQMHVQTGPLLKETLAWSICVDLAPLEKHRGLDLHTTVGGWQFWLLLTGWCRARAKFPRALAFRRPAIWKVLIWVFPSTVDRTVHILCNCVVPGVSALNSIFILLVVRWFVCLFVCSLWENINLKHLCRIHQFAWHSPCWIWSHMRSFKNESPAKRK